MRPANDPCEPLGDHLSPPDYSKAGRHPTSKPLCCAHVVIREVLDIDLNWTRCGRRHGDYSS